MSKHNSTGSHKKKLYGTTNFTSARAKAKKQYSLTHWHVFMSVFLNVNMYIVIPKSLKSIPKDSDDITRWLGHWLDTEQQRPLTAQTLTQIYRPCGHSRPQKVIVVKNCNILVLLNLNLKSPDNINTIMTINAWQDSYLTGEYIKKPYRYLSFIVFTHRNFRNDYWTLFTIYILNILITYNWCIEMYLYV